FSFIFSHCLLSITEECQKEQQRLCTVFVGCSGVDSWKLEATATAMGSVVGHVIDHVMANANSFIVLRNWLESQCPSDTWIVLTPKGRMLLVPPISSPGLG